MSERSPWIGWGSVESRCLTEAVVRSSLRHDLAATDLIAASLEQLMTEGEFEPSLVHRVVVHQCPHEGQVGYRLQVAAEEGEEAMLWFTVDGEDGQDLSKVSHADYLLYLREREGPMQYLRLVC